MKPLDGRLPWAENQAGLQAAYDAGRVDGIREAGMAGSQEWCVQYRCPPGMTGWHEWVGSRRNTQKSAQIELADRLLAEYDPTVEYRVAVRTVTEWEQP